MDQRVVRLETTLGGARFSCCGLQQLSAQAAWNTILVALGLWNRWFANPGPIDGDPYPDWPDLPYPHGPENTLRLLARLTFQSQRQYGKRDKVVLADIGTYFKPALEWPLKHHQPEHALEPRTSPITAAERASRRDYYALNEYMDAIDLDVHDLS